MKTIYKFAVIESQVTIDMPIGAIILSTGVQNNVPCIWAQADSEAETEERNFRLVGTGREIPTSLSTTLSFVGTFILKDGASVLHLFEETLI